MIADPARRRAMGDAGRRIVRERFGCDAGIARLAERFARDGLLAARDETVADRPLRAAGRV
jgi:hypothetical protein